MMSAQQTIGEIASRQPSTIQVFERHGIKYCCHGDDTLGAACGTLALPVEDVLRELSKSVETSTVERALWVDPILEALIGHLLRNSEVRTQHCLAQLQLLASEVGSCHLKEQPNAVQVARLTTILVHEVSSHLSEEAHSLFPKIRQLELAYVGESAEKSLPDGVLPAIARMEREHDSVGHLLSRIRELTGNYDAAAAGCASYRQLCQKLEDFDHGIRRAIHLENNILFMRASQLLRELYG